MGSSFQFLDLFRAQAGADGTLPFACFMQLALYDPQLGYYRQPRRRVGRASGTDFFTASNSPLFGELIAAACVSLLAKHQAQPRDFTFVEIGAEPGGGVLANAAHPFGAVKVLRVGEPIVVDGPCVVFSNELFDAQPFYRFVFRAGAWRELGVALREEALVEVELSTPNPLALSSVEGPAQLPATAPEGYHLDVPLPAAALAGEIAAQPWNGLFLACDYGKSWRELTEDTPAGTARAYVQHMQSSDLLARPGEQDLTCHVCWDWLADALARYGFIPSPIESQEAFFVRHAADFLAATMTAEAARFSEKKLSLLQLLHPAHLGQKFQALHAWRK
ncbi:MAG TPA: SAM-dependent methyltransferase [Opitutaceae bacterium]|jgi:SAM-dependent MidA family methyltransferase|nr:SAM-dependent methyltransferase [Opitutaceae bacterium]